MKKRYHQQHKNKKGSFIYALSIGLLLIVVFVSVTNDSVKEIVQTFYTMFNKNNYTSLSTKRSPLELKNEIIHLKSEINSMVYVENENKSLRKLLNMKQSADGIRQQTIARIIQYNTIPYGTILVKIESQSSHVSRGDIVHYGKWALGTIKNVSGSMALVELYSNTNKTYDVRMNESIGTYTGLSNGTGRVYLPHTSKIVLNTPVSLVQSDKMIIGTIYDKQSQNQNAIKTLLVSLPFNMRDISFVMISK